MHWKNRVQFIFLSNFIQDFCICCSASVLILFPEEHGSLQEHLFHHPHPGWGPHGTLASLCESEVECELNPLHTQWHILGEWLSRPFPSPEDLPDPGIKPTSPALAGSFFTTEPPGKSFKYLDFLKLVQNSLMLTGVSRCLGLV